MKFEYLLKISEIARIAGINVRTLHYYDEIDLFSPKIKDENGYRFYSLEQLVDLGIILSLKELDLPLKRIKSILYSDVNHSKEILSQQRTEIDKKIEKFTDIKNVIERKLHLMELAEKELMEITLVELDEEYLFLSEKINQMTQETHIQTGYNLFLEKGKYLFANNDYGAMVHHDKKDTEAYDFYYLKTHQRDKEVFIKPQGQYLRLVHKGDDESLREAYLKIEEYGRRNNLSFEGYFYERVFNETIQENLDEYITEIQVKIK